MTPAFFQITLKLFLVKDDNFLVLRDRKSGLGDLPGGRLERGEIYNPWHASIHREMEEELGLSLRYEMKPEPLFVFPHWIQDGGHEALGIAFLAHYREGEIRISEEHDFMEWVPILTYSPSPLFRDHMRIAVEKFQNLCKSGGVPGGNHDV